MNMPGPGLPENFGHQNPVPPKPARKKKWPWVVGITTAVIVIAAIAGGQGAKQATTAGSAGSQVLTSTSEVKPTVPAVQSQVEQPKVQQLEPAQVEPVKPATRHVKYAVSGAKRGSITYNERYSGGLPAESVEFERRDDADDVGKFGEASSIAGCEYLPVLDVGYASLNGGS
jgi:hypothetical protein